jgi:integrase/recombinase XerD
VFTHAESAGVRSGEPQEKLSTTAVLGIVAEYAALLSLQLSPHDLRRTCAKVCRLSGGALEQIQFLLGWMPRVAGQLRTRWSSGHVQPGVY